MGPTCPPRVGNFRKKLVLVVASAPNPACTSTSRFVRSWGEMGGSRLAAEMWGSMLLWLPFSPLPTAQILEI